MLTVDLTHPFESVSILNESQVSPQVTEVVPTSDVDKAIQDQQWAQQMNEQKRRLTEACRTLDTAAMALNDSRCRLFTDHKEDIAKLAVEIARKVLMQQVLNGAYDIETIVTKALEHVPSCEGVTVQVNPEDLDQCRQAQDVAESPLDGVTFVADPMIGRAECRVESPKGVIQSLINEHLEQISKALLQKE